MFLFSLIALGVALVAFAFALFSAHIPLLRDWTGAAPLQADEPEPPDHARDFAASDQRGYVIRADWGPDRPRLELPAPAPAPKEDAK